MIKTVSINLGGIVFQIDEDAYGALSKYLNSLTQYYKYTEGRDEIVSDIESRLGELFTENFEKTGFNVVSLGDVDEVIEIMGRPEDFDDEEDVKEEAKEARKKSGSTIYTSRKLYRDPDDGILAGVSSGLSTYFKVEDPIWIRIVFILLTFSGLIGPIVYLILWAVLEPATTAAQKIAMTGEPITVSNLEKKIKEELDIASQNLKGFASRGRDQGILTQIVNGIGKVFGGFAKLAWVLAKIFFFAIVGVLLLSLILVLFVSIFSFLGALPLAFKYLFSSSLTGLLAAIGGILTLAIPLFLLFYIPYRIWSKNKTHSKSVVPVAIVLFIIGVICSGIATLEVYRYYSTTEMDSSEESIPYPMSDTLYLSINADEEAYKNLEINLNARGIYNVASKLETASNWIELDILPSSDGNIYLEEVKRSTGKNDKLAAQNAKAISYNVKTEGDRIVFDQFFGMGKNKKWRNQKVKLKLYIPDSLNVVFDREMDKILDNTNNSVNANANTVAGNRWLMNGGVLEPIDSNLTMGSSWSRQNMESFNFANFDEIKIKTNLQAEIVQGDKFEVYMSATHKQAKYVEVEKEGNELIFKSIGSRNRGVISLGWMDNLGDRPHFYITVPELSSISIGSQAHAIITDFTQDEIDFYLSAQGSLVLDDFKFETLNIEMHGQSDVELIGESNKINVDCSGQSDVYGEEFTVNNAKIRLSGQSDAEFKVLDRVEGKLSGQSDFYYWGDPEVEIQTSGQADYEQQ